jgi:D-glycerate 3-kinase
VRTEVVRRFPGGAGRTVIIGICGAQGSGKSTLTATMADYLRQGGNSVATLSLDDLYLRRAERAILAAEVHPLLATRGVPGTHEIALGEQVLAALSKPGRVRVPRFDKSIDDRLPDKQWDEVDGPVDFILFEGWCVGASPEDECAIKVPINVLERQEDADGTWRQYVNSALASDYQRLFSRLDVLVLLAAPSFDIVAEWRNQQEVELRETLAQRGEPVGRGIMSAEEIARFVQHYERVSRHILAEMPDRADLVVQMDELRRVISINDRQH